MQQATIFDIQRFSLHDGPGIRTTVFLKGCPLRCIWCHNPESWSPRPQLLWDRERCVHCGRCATACRGKCHLMEGGRHTFRAEGCQACRECLYACPTPGTLEMCGRECSTDEVLRQVLEDLPYYRQTGGGLTLSGGEPMAHPAFSGELLRKAKEQGISTAMETCGYALSSLYEEILPWVDLFLFDVKAVSPAKHREFTGKDNALILENLHFLHSRGVPIRLRCPLVPGYNDSAEDLLGIAELANSLPGLQGIDLEPYHPLGVSKARKLGIASPFQVPLPTPDRIRGWKEILSRTTTVPVECAG